MKTKSIEFILMVSLLLIFAACELHNIEWNSPFGKVKIESIRSSTVSGPAVLLPANPLPLPEWTNVSCEEQD